jgi:ubiquinone/menaquinone biosynthesis C-methylase UbiE
MKTDIDERILEHYRQEASEHDLRPTSTMKDETTREFEIRSILACLGYVGEHGPMDRLLEIGCGNGHLLALIRDGHPETELVGMDISPEMVQLARTRNISSCQVAEGDVRALTYPDDAFDVVVSERCLINILDTEAQGTALEEVARVVRPGGHVVLIEAFTDGLENLNRARGELGLPPIPMTHHNLWFHKAWFLERIRSAFDVVTPENGDAHLPPTNFLSTHFFMSRVLYPAVTRAELAYNTEFVKFFRFLPPQGDFAPIQLFLLRRKP